MSGFGMFGVLFFDDPVIIKIFLSACLVFLAVYLFFLQGKLFILGFSLARKSERIHRIKTRPQTVATSIRTVSAPPADASPAVPEPPLATAPDIHPPVLIDAWSRVPTTVDEKETTHRAKVVDRIRGRYLTAEKKLKLLKVLWIVIAVLTVVFIITY